MAQVVFSSTHCTESSNLTDTEQSDSEAPARPSTTRSSSERMRPQPSTARTASQRRRQRTSAAKVSKPSGTLTSGSHGNIAVHGRGLSRQDGATHGTNQPESSPSPPHWLGGVSSPSADRRKKTRLLMEAQKGKSQGSRTADTSVQVLVYYMGTVMRSGASLWTCGRQGGERGEGALVEFCAVLIH